MFIFCPKCNQKYEVDDEYAGVEVHCEKCGNDFNAQAEKVEPVPRSTVPKGITPVMRPGLVLCSSCGAPVAKSAKMCPRCGAPGAKQWFSISSVISLLLLVLSLLIGIGAGMESGNSLNVIAGFLLAIWLVLVGVLIKLK